MQSGRRRGRATAWTGGFALVAMLGCPAPTPPQSTEPGAPEPAVATNVPVPRKVPAGSATPPGIALGSNGAVASAESAASRVGLRVLEQGGNAVDAAVAVGFALAVTHPSAGNLGGGGFMVVALADGRAAAFDYRERAPGKATRDMFLDAAGEPTRESLIGPKAAGIPGTVAGLALAHETFGSVPWAELVAPAITLARDGVVLDRFHAADLEHGASYMRESGFVDAARHYEKPDGSYYREGERWQQPELAVTLERIATLGPRAFYEGELARTLAEGVAAAGGIWTTADLASYRAVVREPIRFEYHGHEVVTMPPPSAGGVVLRQLLAAADVLELRRYPWRSTDEVHLHVEAARRTYADRNLLLGDPDFIDLPLSRLLSTDYVRARMADVDLAHATPSSAVSSGLPPGKQESHETTHYSIVDRDGNAVANTYTLNLGFGAGFVVPGTGVLLNNEMDDFAAKPGRPNAFGLVQGETNAIAPGKRMLSSMTPTILRKDGELRAVLGSPGGSTITTTVAQITRAIVDYGLPLDAAVEAVRVHHQWLPDTITAEEGLPPDVEAELRARGHALRKRGSIGHANCIEVDPATRGFRAVADVRRDGGEAVAY